ncbi:MAG: SDR family NAD(P)-dependent oxidoreductase [Labilithrix sp.]|nr:SDR family NAD(P)-dependent oxidoreductase [Labilithrix sp.]
MKRSLPLVSVAVLAGLGLVRRVRRARERKRLAGKTAFVGGASRGLGRAIARELAAQGCRVVICARHREGLEEVRAELAALGAEVYAEPCDLRNKEEVDAFVTNATDHLGPIDIVVTVAATLEVGPIETMSVRDFDDAIRAIFKTALHPALAVLPDMRARGSRAGRLRRGAGKPTLAFVTSVGGKIGVPHLAPYSAAKFAVVGLAEALRAEVHKDGVSVLTIVPGLMRTGSWVHATFKGDADREYAWFGSSATAPFVTIDADRAAQRIVRAIARGDEELVLTAPAKLAVRVHDLMPRAFAFAMSVFARLLPRAPEPFSAGARGREGLDIERRAASPGVRYVRERGHRAATRHHQL